MTRAELAAIDRSAALIEIDDDGIDRRAQSRASFAERWVRSCTCADPLDIRIDEAGPECGRCGAPIRPREGA
jgi:hypothetical protein